MMVEKGIIDFVQNTGTVDGYNNPITNIKLKDGRTFKCFSSKILNLTAGTEFEFEIKSGKAGQYLSLAIGQPQCASGGTSMPGGTSTPENTNNDSTRVSIEAQLCLKIAEGLTSALIKVGQIDLQSATINLKSNAEEVVDLLSDLKLRIQNRYNGPEPF